MYKKTLRQFAAYKNNAIFEKNNNSSFSLLLLIIVFYLPQTFSY